MLCFTSPNIPDQFSKLESWSPRDFRDYAEYLNDWTLIEYILRYIKDHHDLGGRNEEVSQFVTTLIRKLASNQASYYLRSFINFLFRHNTRPIPAHEDTIFAPVQMWTGPDQSDWCKYYQDISENIQYRTLNAAIEPKLPHVVKALQVMCRQDNHHPERKTPLIISAQKGFVGATRLFLDLDVDKNAKDNSGWTALHHAVENGSEAVVRLLVEQGADKRIRDNCKETALHIAVKKL
jgi:hypothetical protein